MAMSRADDLFDRPTQVEVSVLPKDRVVFLTNRYNLLQILSAGYIGARESYGKYYADLLELCPGRIPLLKGPLDASVQALAGAGAETSFPVALEIDVTRVGQEPIPCLLRSGVGSRLPLQSGEAVAWAPSGALTLEAVTRILFRSAAELEEHSIRTYANINPARLPLAVDASLFDAEGETSGALRDWIRQLPEARGSVDDYVFQDRLSGAGCVAVASVKHSPAAVEAILALLNVNAPQRRASSPTKTRRADASRLISEILLGQKRSGVTLDLDGRLAVASGEVLRSADSSNDWRPLDVLSAIESLVRVKKLAKKDELELSKNVESIRGILRNDRDFKPFKRGVGLVAAKGLLLALMRPDPLRLLSWPMEETGADAPVMFIASVLCGLLNGRERLPVEVRPPMLDRVLARLSVNELASESDALILAAQGELEAFDIKCDVEGTAVLSYGKLEIMRWTLAPKGAAELIDGLDLTVPSAEVAAIEMCRVLKWSDAVVGRIVLDSGRVVVSTVDKGKALSLEVRGWSTFTHTLDARVFRERLSSDGVPQDSEKDIMAILGRLPSKV